MSNFSDFKARVQFTFKSPSNMQGDEAELHAKVLEMFDSKKKLGMLRHWLIGLAYEAAAKELSKNGGGGRSGFGCFEPNGNAVGSPVEQDSHAGEKRSVAPVSKGSGQKAKDRVEYASVASSPLGSISHDSIDMNGGVDAHWDAEEHARITITGKSESRKKTPLPKGLGSLVMATE